ncbi:hypothetical protein PDY_21740 [Photobacterium damselae subsp. damselae]|nr:hypothetical protein PDY_21740 [Photobacterium damselae subsp. damselae]
MLKRVVLAYRGCLLVSGRNHVSNRFRRLLNRAVLDKRLHIVIILDTHISVILAKRG